MRPDAPDTAGEFQAYFNVSRETCAYLTRYEALLKHWQRRINLVGPASLPAFWRRHASDSAQILALAAPSAKIWLDLGSGAGFPGLVVALLLAGRGQNDVQVHLVESHAKKCAFLRAVVAETGAPVRVHHGRIEALRLSVPPDIICARALAPLPDLLQYAAPHFGAQTRALFHKGRNWQEELTDARQWWTFESDSHASATDPAARIVEIGGLSRK